MSILAGIWNKDGAPASSALLSRISHATEAYGPDGEEVHIEKNVGILFRSRHTTAESRLARQPYVSLRDQIFTWDGRLDNRDELVSQLDTHSTEAAADVEIVSSAFEKWGVGCFPRLKGDWALAVWDPGQQELTLARDYIGIRPLFYYATTKALLWCSHLSPLALSGDHFTVCDEYIAGFLAMWPDAHLTPFNEISSVSPGTFVRVRHNRMISQSYWSFDTSLRTRHKSDQDYEQEYRHLLRQAVRRRLRSDSRILAELSGGFDSSSIVCMADDIARKQTEEAVRVDTISFYDPDEPEDDDLHHFNEVKAYRQGQGHHAIIQSTGDSFQFEYEYFTAQPGFRNRTEIATKLTEVVRQGGYRVVLTGRGGDDLNGQPLDPRVYLGDLAWQLRLVTFFKELNAWSAILRKTPWVHLLFQTLQQFMPPLLRTRLNERGRVEPWINPLFALKHDMAARQLELIPGTWLMRPSARDALQTLKTISRRIGPIDLPDLEYRYPFLDQDLVMFLTTIPIEQLLKPGERRSLMRRALAGILPDSVLRRKTKALALRYCSITLQKHWHDVERLLSAPIAAEMGYIDKDHTRHALALVKAGRFSIHTARLLNALALEVWLRHIHEHGILAMNTPHTVRGLATTSQQQVKEAPFDH